MKNKKLLTILISIGVLICLVITYFYFQKYINEFLSNLNILLKKHIYIAFIILFVFSLLDTTIGIVGPSGSALFVASAYYKDHFIWLALISYLGVFVGTSIMYYIAYYFSKKHKFHNIKHKFKKIWNIYHNNAEISVVIFSATAATNIISLLSGMTKMKYIHFVIMTFIGRFVISYLVATNLLRYFWIFIKQPNLITGLIVVCLLTLLLLIIAFVYIWEKRVHKNENNN